MTENGESTSPSAFRGLVEQRHLLWSFVRRDLQMRYGASFMGFFWSVINPLMQIAIYTLIFGYFLQITVGGSSGPMNYGIFLFSGMLPWLAFSEAVGKSSMVILANKDLVKQVNFATILLPTNVIISSFIHELIALALFVTLLFLIREPPGLTLVGILLFFPLQIMFTLGVSLIVAGASVYFKDVRELVSAFLPLWFFGSPIIYSVDMVPDSIRPFYELNPLVPLVNVYHAVLLGDVMPDVAGFVYFASWAVLLFFVGVRSFNRLSRDFGDLL
jgi:homopolymeric O-antigen transport system permease protein